MRAQKCTWSLLNAIGSLSVSLIQKFRGVFLPLHVLLFSRSQHYGWSKQHFLAPKRIILGNCGHKTAHQPAKWASTGKPKASKVTLGYKGLMIPLSWIHLTPKTGGLMVVALKKCRLRGQNWAPAATTRPSAQQGQHKNVVLLVSRHDDNKQFGWFPKEHRILATKKDVLPQKLHFLCYTLFFMPPGFGLTRTRFNGIINSPYHEPMRYFGCLRFSGRWAVGLFYGPNCPKLPFLGPKNVVYSTRNAVIWGTSKHAVVKIHP